MPIEKIGAFPLALSAFAMRGRNSSMIRTSFCKYSRLNVTLVPQELPAVVPCQVEELADSPQYGKSQLSKNTRLEPDSSAAWWTSSSRKNARAAGLVKFQKGEPFPLPRQTSPAPSRRNSSGRL